MMLRAAAQAATVVLLARQLGARDYGQVVVVIAVASFLVPLAGLGLSHIVLRNAARDLAHWQAYVACALRWWWRTLPVAIGIAIALAILLLPGKLPMTALCVAIAGEIAASSITELYARYRQAQHRLHAFGAINAGLPLCRLLALGALLLLADPPTPSDVLWVYAVSGLAYVAMLWRTLPDDEDQAGSTPGEPMTAFSGLPFSLAVLAAKLQAEFNKPVLAQTSFGLAGSYNVAQRVVDMASLPLLAMQEALWPRLYPQSNPMPQLRHTGGALMALALLLGAALWLVAPLLPILLGESFADAVPVLQLLAWLPVLQMFRALLNFHAIHHGRIHRIGWASGVGAVVSVAGVAMLAPQHGMTGAVAAAYLSEIAMTTFLLVIALRASPRIS